MEGVLDLEETPLLCTPKTTITTTSSNGVKLGATEGIVWDTTLPTPAGTTATNSNSSGTTDTNKPLETPAADALSNGTAALDVAKTDTSSGRSTVVGNSGVASPPPALCVAGLRCGWRPGGGTTGEKGRPVLDGVDLSVNFGEFAVVSRQKHIIVLRFGHVLAARWSRSSSVLH